ncbi:MAG: 16S rRNA (cytidine(1402)-2'-O)-methyltransferase [Candidatus Komeilibacteria bacterium]|nr:16S rRNA (cytidine(1402)-2'-O)-methyltransferase [Candidatus Komeilibacteria bacterium]
MTRLAVVATPLGNLEDFTFRALKTLEQAEIILCEDTRVTNKLLQHYAIKGKKLVSLHQHSTIKEFGQVKVWLEQNKRLALVTDAGTPGVADPGNQLIQWLVAETKNSDIAEPIPGPSALAAALSVCGFVTDEFLFLGFLPHKKGRQTQLAEIAKTNRTIVLFESVHRLVKLLGELVVVIPSRQLVVMKELTKQFETMWRGTAGELLKQIPAGKIKGEFVVVIDKAK